jgi:hypothetical protein
LRHVRQQEKVDKVDNEGRRQRAEGRFRNGDLYPDPKSR